MCWWIRLHYEMLVDMSASMNINNSDNGIVKRAGDGILIPIITAYAIAKNFSLSIYKYFSDSCSESNIQIPYLFFCITFFQYKELLRFSMDTNYNTIQKKEKKKKIKQPTLKRVIHSSPWCGEVYVFITT